MQSLAVVYYPEDNWEEVNQFRKKYDPQWKVISPHITIVSPISEISQAAFIEHVVSITKRIKSFSIQLSMLKKSFDDYLFLETSEGRDEIISLHNKLYTGIFTPYIPTDFIFSPHITLGFFRTNENILDNALFKKAYEEAEEMKFVVKCKFDALSIITGDGINPAKTIKTIMLQQRQSIHY